VNQSARDLRRSRTVREISRCARTLALERGLDGFTMEDLADAVGVSRRTLFNYVPGKIDAILGETEGPDESAVALFASGGPSGHLVHDVTELIAAALEADESAAEDIDAVRTLVRTEHRLHQELHARFVEITDRFSEAIAEREGAGHDPLRARVVAMVMIGLLDVALDESLADPTRSLADHYRGVVSTTGDLFTAS